MKSLMVDFARNFRVSENRLELRCKDEISILNGIKQRLFADSVSRQQQSLRSIVPEGEGKHSAQSLRGIASILLVRVNNDFSIAACIEGMTEGFQFSPQFLVIVDFSVEHNPYSSIFVMNGLIPGDEINHCQASNSETYRGVLAAVDPGRRFRRRIRIVARALRAAMNHCVAHSSQRGFVDGLVISIGSPCYSAQNDIPLVISSGKVVDSSC